MDEIVLPVFAFMPQAAFKQGRVLLVLAVIWFCMANFNKRGRLSFSTILYMIIGVGFFVASVICFISVFFQADRMTRIAIVGMLTFAAVMIAFIIAYTIVRKENRQKKIMDAVKEVELDAEGGERDGFE